MLICFAATAVAADNTSFVTDGYIFKHTWSNQTPRPLTARSDMTATTVGNAIYLIGGCGIEVMYTVVVITLALV